MNNQSKCKLRVSVYQNSLYSGMLSLEKLKNYITAKDEKAVIKYFSEVDGQLENFIK